VGPSKKLVSTFVTRLPQRLEPLASRSGPENVGFFNEKNHFRTNCVIVRTYQPICDTQARGYQDSLLETARAAPTVCA